MTNWVKLKFAAMNLKKLAKWKWMNSQSSLLVRIFPSIWMNYPVAVYAVTGFFDRLTSEKPFTGSSFVVLPRDPLSLGSRGNPV